MGNEFLGEPFVALTIATIAATVAMTMAAGIIAAMPEIAAPYILLCITQSICHSINNQTPWGQQLFDAIAPGCFLFSGQ